MNCEPKGLEKLNRVLINDKRLNAVKLNEILSCDLYKTLLNYLDIKREDVISKIETDEDGYYVFRCKVKCKRIKIMGLL